MADLPKCGVSLLQVQLRALNKGGLLTSTRTDLGDIYLRRHVYRLTIHSGDLVAI